MSMPLVARPRAAVLFAAAGACLLVAQALLPVFPAEISRQVAVAAAHRGAETASAVAFLAGGVLMAFAMAATGLLVLARGRTLTKIGLVVTGVGAFWPVAGRAAYDAILVALTGTGDHSTAATALDAISNSGAFAVFLPLLVAFAFGPVLLALGLRRAGTLAVTPALLWFAGVLVVNATEDSSRVGATAGMALVAAAFTWIGLAVDGRASGAPAVEPALLAA